MLSILSCTCWPSVCLWKNVYLGLLPIFNCFLILSYMSSLYTLDINPLSDISFANIFSHSVDWHFILLAVSLAGQKCLGLIRSQLFIFVFLARGDTSNKIYLGAMSKCVLPMFSASFYGFRSYIQVFNPFGVYFCVSCEEMIDLHSFKCCCPVFSASVIEEASLSSLPPVSWITWPYIRSWIYFWLSVLFCRSGCLFLCHYHSVLITVV